MHRLDQHLRHRHRHRHRIAAGAAVLASVAVGALRDGPWSVRVATAVCGTATAVAALCDVRTGRLPNRLVVAVAASAMWLAIVGGWSTFSGATAGAVVVAAVVVSARFVASGGVGAGDAKLAAAIGLACGAVSPRLATFAMVIVAASALVSALVVRRSRFPLGPSLWLGWCIAESAETLTASSFRPPSVGFYTGCCVASAELLQRASLTLGGGTWE